MSAVVFASRLSDAFLLAIVGALAVTTVSLIVAFVRWLGRIDTRFGELDERVTALEAAREGPSIADLDDRMKIMERDRGPVLDTVHHRLDGLDDRITALEQPPPPPPRPVPPQPRRRK